MLPKLVQITPTVTPPRPSYPLLDPPHVHPIPPHPNLQLEFSLLGTREQINKFQTPPPPTSSEIGICVFILLGHNFFESWWIALGPWRYIRNILGRVNEVNKTAYHQHHKAIPTTAFGPRHADHARPELARMWGNDRQVILLQVLHPWSFWGRGRGRG